MFILRPLFQKFISYFSKFGCFFFSNHSPHFVGVVFHAKCRGTPAQKPTQKNKIWQREQRRQPLHLFFCYYYHTELQPLFLSQVSFLHRVSCCLLSCSVCLRKEIAFLYTRRINFWGCRFVRLVVVGMKFWAVRQFWWTDALPQWYGIAPYIFTYQFFSSYWSINRKVSFYWTILAPSSFRVLSSRSCCCSFCFDHRLAKKWRRMSPIPIFCLLPCVPRRRTMTPQSLRAWLFPCKWQSPGVTMAVDA